MTLFTGSASQQRALALAPKVPALLSFLGSSSIIASIARDRKKLASSNHRLLFGMSACDFAVSIWWFLSSWAMPRGTWWQAAGNDATCKTQAFMVQFSMANVFYNGSLGLYYFLVVRQGWNKSRIRKIEPFLHAVPLLMGLVPSFILMVGLGVDQAFGPLCFMGQRIIGMVDNLLPIAVGAVVTAMMFLMYRSVRNKETAMQRYAGSAINSSIASANTATTKVSLLRRNKSFQKTRMVATQGIFYSIPFFVTWAPALVFTILHMIIGIPVNFELFMTFCILEPAQGFLNFLVYVRPACMRYYQARRKEAAAARKARNEQRASAAQSGLSVPSGADPDGGVIVDPQSELSTPSGTEPDGEAIVDINDADDVNAERSVPFMGQSMAPISEDPQGR